MNHWKTIFLNQWRAKLISFAVAVLLWLAIRHAMLPSPADGVSTTHPSGTRLPLAFQETDVEKVANVFPS